MTNRLFLLVDPNHLIGINHVGASFRYPSGQLSIYLVNHLEPLHLVIPDQAKAAWAWLNNPFNLARFVRAGEWIVSREHVTAASRDESHVSIWVTSKPEPIKLAQADAQAAWADLSSMLHATTLFTPDH